MDVLVGVGVGGRGDWLSERVLLNGNVGRRLGKRKRGGRHKVRFEFFLNANGRFWLIRDGVYMGEERRKGHIAEQRKKNWIYAYI